MERSTADPNLADDPRWRRLHDLSWACPCCGEIHAGVFDLACAKPDFWDGDQDPSPNAVAASSTHFLSDDFCVMDDGHFYVRCVLCLPIIGSDRDFFAYGAWSSLSRGNFRLYLDGFDSGDFAEEPSWFGWFANRLTGYPDTLNLKCRVRPRPGRQRPMIELEPGDHPLAVEQRSGIPFDRLLQIYALNGHDLRDHLSH